METHRAPADELSEFRSEAADGTRASVAVVIPVYDDPDGIETTVRSIQDAPYPDLEILPVFTPSDGETKAVLDDIAADDERVRVFVEDEHQTPGAARNVGVDHADGDLLVFTDADMTVAPELPWKVAYAFDSSTVDYLGYDVEIDPAEDESMFGWYDRHVRFGNEFLMDFIGFCPTCALAVRDTVLESGIRFHPDLVSAEDVLFGQEVSEAGFELGYSPDIHVEHPARNSLSAIIKKGKKTGQGWYDVYTDDSVDVFSKSPIREHGPYLPDPPWFLEGVCDEWETMSRSERRRLLLLSYVENLSKFWGYSLAVVSR